MRFDCNARIARVDALHFAWEKDETCAVGTAGVI